MKCLLIKILIKAVMVVCVLSLQATFAQGTFRNLNFEDSTVSPSGPDGEMVPMGTAFPSWVGYWDTNSAPYATHNSLSVGTVNLSILGPNYALRIQGSFTALLQAGGLSSSTPVYSAALAQVGTVPTGIQSIMFHSRFTRPEVTFNGQLIPAFLLGSGIGVDGAPYEILGGDISAFAGQEGELRFTSYAPQSQFGSATYLDDIFFSNQQVPEPNALGLFGLGAVLFGYHWRRFGKLP